MAMYESEKQENNINSFTLPFLKFNGAGAQRTERINFNDGTSSVRITKITIDSFVVNQGSAQPNFNIIDVVGITYPFSSQNSWNVNYGYCVMDVTIPAYVECQINNIKLEYEKR